MTSNREIAQPRLDLSSCAHEPLHIPGSIQPHGVLLALAGPELAVQHASSNCLELLRVAAPDLIGTPFPHLLAGESAEQLRAALQAQNLRSVNPLRLRLTVAAPETTLSANAHRSGDLLVLELERYLAERDPSFPQVYRRINQAVEEIGATADLAQLYRVTLDHVKALSGYQRVMLYQFDPQWNGKVVAEVRESHQEPFLGLHYPASDIPEQARQLYQTNWVRVIPDVDAAPSPVIPSTIPTTGEPLDLSQSVFRSVSPIHIQYLKNMGVGASTSISVIHDGQLWGLIALHHERATFLSFEVRQGLELIGRMFSAQLAARSKHENLAYKARLKSVQADLLRAMRQASAFLDGLHRGEQTLLDLAAGCTGGAIIYRGHITLIGAAPKADQVRQLAIWLKDEMDGQPLFHTTCLSREYPDATAIKDVASGLLAISIPEIEPNYVLWFKPEVVQTVNWGGNPNKPVETSAGGAILSPRRSFALWQQTLRLKSLPWQAEEIEAIEALRRSIIEVDLERQVRAAMTSNAELDEFAAVVAHDLKEPLRGIGFFADFLEEDLAQRLDAPARAYLREIKQLSEKGKLLVNELYEYSKLGRVEMAFGEVDLNPLVSEVAARLAGAFAERNGELCVPRPLPPVVCDRIRIAEVFANLFINALKYNQQPKPRIEVSAGTAGNSTVISVADNGIGIPTAARERVFKMFQRLHGPQQFGGGTGVGLAIVKRVIDRHGGRIWIESGPQGSTFHFTLQPDQPVPEGASR